MRMAKAERIANLRHLRYLSIAILIAALGESFASSRATGWRSCRRLRVAKTYSVLHGLTQQGRASGDDL